MLTAKGGQKAEEDEGTCNPAVDRQPGLRRPGLAEQQCFSLGISILAFHGRPSHPPAFGIPATPSIVHLFPPFRLQLPVFLLDSLSSL